MSLSEKRYLHHCSLRSEKNQRTWDKHTILMKKSLLPAHSFFHTNKQSETRVPTEFKFVSKTEIKSRPGKRANQDSPWKTKRANSCSSQIWDPEAQTSSRVWHKKYPGINWNYWFLTNGNWSYCCRVWAIQARSITTSRRNIRTKSGSSWNLYQEYARHGRIAEKSRVKGRGTFKKKNDWRLWGSKFILPGLECQDSLQPWRQRREVPRCWDWRRAHQEFAGFIIVPSGARGKCELVAGLPLAQEKACFNVHSQFLASTGKPSTGCQKSAYLTKSSTIVNLLPTFPLVSQVRASTLSTYAQHAIVSPFGGAWGAAGKTISDRACRSKWCTVSRPGLPIRATSSFRMYTPWASLQKRHHADCNTRMSAWTQSCTELRETRSTVVAIEPCDWTFFVRMTAWIREALQCSTTWGRLPRLSAKPAFFKGS